MSQVTNILVYRCAGTGEKALLLSEDDGLDIESVVISAGSFLLEDELRAMGESASMTLILRIKRPKTTYCPAMKANGLSMMNMSINRNNGNEYSLLPLAERLLKRYPIASHVAPMMRMVVYRNRCRRVRKSNAIARSAKMTHATAAPAREGT